MRPLLFLPLILTLACSRQDSSSTKNSTSGKSSDNAPVILENEDVADLRAVGQREDLENNLASIITPPNPLRELEAKNPQALYQRARNGDMAAAVDLGLMYFHGIKTKRDHGKAKQWWQYAARQGNQAAVQNLGILIAPPKREAVSFFGTPGQGNRFVFIIDKSGSMEGNRLAHAKRELVATLNQLPAHALFMVYFFDDNADPMQPQGMMEATPANLKAAMRWVMGRSCQGGGTNPGTAIHKAFRLKPDTIWLLSDGVFAQEHIGLVKRLNHGDRTRVNTLAFHDPSGEGLLKAIAGQNGGRFRFVAAER